MADIIVDTYKLSGYAQRISAVNKRISNLDRRLDSLYQKVGLAGLFDLVRVDAMVSYSARLLAAQTYLNSTAKSFERLEKDLASKDPASFKRPEKKELDDVIFDVGVAVKKTAQKVKKKIQETADTIYTVVQDVKENYEEHGWVYDAVQYGKAVLKCASGVKKIVLGVGSLIGSGGLSTPVSVLMVISGCNDVYNSIMDVTYVATDNYDMVGTDALEEKMKEAGGIVGGWLGNEEAGEDVGQIIYYGMDLVTTLVSLDASLDKVKQLPSVNVGQLGNELREIGNLDVSHIFTTDVEALKYELKLASYTFKSTTDFVKNVKALGDVGKEAFSVGKVINDMIQTPLHTGNNHNPVIDFYDNVTDIAGKVGKGAKVVSKVTSVIFD